MGRLFYSWVDYWDDVFESLRRFGGRAPGWLRCNQFGNADQVIGDQIEQEVGGDASDATMFGLSHGAMLLAPTEDALGHRPARLRHAVPRMPRGSLVDGALAGLAGFGDGLILRHMRRHADGAKIGAT